MAANALNTLLSDFVDEQKKRAVWDKARVVLTHDPDVHRQDEYGYWIQYDQYGDRQSTYGWEFDHIIPASKGGSDDISNLRPLHWQINASRGNRLGATLLSGR